MDAAKKRMWEKANGSGKVQVPKKEEKCENEAKDGGERKVGEKSASRQSSQAVDMQHKKKIFKKM